VLLKLILGIDLNTSVNNLYNLIRLEEHFTFMKKNIKLLKVKLNSYKGNVLKKSLRFRNLYKYERADSAWTNLLFWGDNKIILNMIESNQQFSMRYDIKGTVKLIYLDPPYSTGRGIYNCDESLIYTDKIVGINYIEFIKQRLIQLWELLEPNGVMFIHLNSNKSHYIKVLMDELFGRNKFVNEIVWQNTNSGKTTSRNLSRDFHTIYWYAKGCNYVFNPIFTDLSVITKKKYNRDDNDGRGFYRLIPLQKTNSQANITRFDYMDNNGQLWRCPSKGWRMRETKLKELENQNRLYLDGNKIYEKSYWNERVNNGKLCGNFWNDIPNLQGSNYETTGYPTQKPEKLIQRIVQMCTNEGDLVLDAFAGSGTTLCAAEKLKRRWIGIDCRLEAINTIRKRLLNINLTRDLINSREFFKEDLKAFNVFAYKDIGLNRTVARF
jgi:adenine-specific DNA-methyltransferase